MPAMLLDHGLDSDYTELKEFRELRGTGGTILTQLLRDSGELMFNRVLGTPSG